ncbi:MAG: AzlC family ABC transporter permease [Rhodoluna sp.]
MSKSGSLVSMSVGVGLATGLYGISFGALSTAAGLDIWQTQVLSLLMFSGGSQFAFIGVIAAGGPAAVGAAVVSAWLLGVRNGFYAVRMNPILEALGLRRFIAAQLTIDESTAVSTAQNSASEQRRGFWFTGAAVFVFWNSMTLLGAVLGNALGDPTTWGLDAAAAAAFLGLLWPRLRERQALAVAALAFLIAVITTPSLPAGLPVIIAGVVAVVVGWFNFFTPKAEVKP